MQNYQLYSTNINLGGQMKWDLILESEGELFIKDFHLTPISNAVPYNKYLDDYLLNYTHQENIRSFYKKIEGYFYNTCISPELKHNWPIISDKLVKTYDDTYIMGCRRCKDFNIYKKQFEFLCPIWVEKLTGDLKFNISIYTLDNKHISSKCLVFNKKNIDYHDKFINYFKNYISLCELDTGNDDVINIDLSDQKAVISGVSIINGNIISKEVNRLVSNMLYRERPIMENASMIINEFKDNLLITKQLFNFNLCFNIEDLLPYHITKELYGKRFNIKVTISDDNGVFNEVDLYNNFTNIDKTYIDYVNVEEPSKKPNIFEYLKEDRYIEFYDKNKFAPNIVHWSLVDNSDYIFNLSDGFCGYYINDDKEIYNHGTYADSPNLFYSEYSKGNNNIGWNNVIRIDNYKEFENIYTYYTIAHDKYASSLNTNWLKNIKYKNPINVDLLLIYISDKKIYDSASNIIKDKLNDNTLYYSPYTHDGNKFVMILSNNSDNLTYRGLSKILKDFENVEDTYIDKAVIKDIYNFMSSAVVPDYVILNKSIIPNRVDGPTSTIKEIEYLKLDKYYKYVIRYDGKLKPAFVNIKDNKNVMHYKDSLTESDYRTSKYSKYAKSKYSPLYQSIDFYPIFNIPINYDKFPNELKYDTYEYTWYNRNTCLFLIPELNISLKSKLIDGEYVSIEYLIKEYLKEKYKIENDVLLNSIYNMYNIEYSYDYQNKYNIKDYNYNIKLILK